MALPVHITGPRKNHIVRVGDKQDLHVSVHPGDPPERGQRSRYRFLTGLLGSTGLGSGTVNMNVDGSSSPQTFYAGSADEYDILIMGVSILIADTGIVHNNFGTLGALATGWDLILTEAGEETVLMNKVQTNGQVIAASGFGRSFGDGAEMNELVNWTATDDAAIAYMTFGEWVPGGLRIARGSRDRLRSVVNDNLTGLTDFRVRLFGYRHYLEV